MDPPPTTPGANRVSFAQLLTLLRANDSVAWSYVYERFLPLAVAALRRQFGAETARPEGIGGEAAVSAFRTLERRITDGQFEDLKDEHQFAALFLRIAFNKCARKHRRQRRYVTGAGTGVSADDAPVPSESVVSPDRSPDQEVFRQDALAEVDSAIGEVRRRLRAAGKKKYEQVFRLRMWTDSSNDEIATRVGCSASSVKRAWSYSLDLLRGLLDESLLEDLSA